MTPSVVAAIEGLKKAFPNGAVSVLAEDGQGGAHVMVEEVQLGPKFAPSKTWLGAHLPASLPYADVYPLFMSPEVKRLDGAALSGPLSGVNWQGRQATQISRRNNRIGVGQSAVAKFIKVVEFVRSLA